MIRRPPRSTRVRSSAASDVYKRQVRDIARLTAEGKIDPDHITEKTFRTHLDEPEVPDVDLFWRSSGEQRTSNFLLWQSAYAEMVFSDVLWPDVDRRDLWAAVVEYAKRDRRFGGAVPYEVNPTP